MSSETVLSVQGLTIDFLAPGANYRAVNGVSFSVRKGETLVILGESGSGKSVSTSAILDILDIPPARIAAGQVLFDGDDLLRIDQNQRRSINGRRIGIVFQDPLAHLNPLETIGRQLAEVFEVHTEMVKADIRQRCIELLQRVGLPDADQRINDYPHQFSGGQRQRVMIAMAIALDPDLVIADEPTTALDVSVQAQILDLFKSLQRERGMALVMITHDLEVAAAMGDQVVVMRGGKIVEAGAMRTVFEHPEDSYTRALLDAIPKSGQVGRTKAKSEETLFAVHSLSKNYQVASNRGGTVQAVDDVSFSLMKGETLAVVGESGSGKSTVARILMRLEMASGGSVLFEGRDILTLSGDELLAYRRNVQMVFQDPFSSLNPRMRVDEIIQEVWHIHKGICERSHWRDRVVELLEQVGLTADHAVRYPHQFSGGQRQRIAIARALACRSKVLICDEAVSALDVSVAKQVIDLLAELKDTLGLSYLFITHDLPVVRDFADRVLVMKAGKIVETGQTDQIFDRPRTDYARALMASRPKPKWQANGFQSDA